MFIYKMLFINKDARVYCHLIMLILSVTGCKQTQDPEQNMVKDNQEHSISKAEVLTEKNRKIIEDFADIFYNQKDVAKAFDKYVSEGYIQHNSNILDGPKAAIDALKPKFSAPTSSFEIKRILVDGNMAVIHLHARMDNNFKGGAVADFYRLENGKIVEHWDVLQPISDNPINPRPMF
ncbi:nuclear transport factor 2 family protein [Maribacter sp. CXY002]|uniref:nuclear transport factor 2 family protein n=1 Tax=Maribacter luteocoastalis TaxID=3407671 RepID=UPI003B6738D8